MKTIGMLAGALLLCAMQSTAEVKFLKGPLSEALGKAQAEKKPVMIDFMTDWCMWCDTLDTYTYADTHVAEFVNGNIIPIKIDAEKGEGVALAKKYSVQGYPTILLIDASGEEIDRLVGYVPPVPFLQTVKDYVSGVNTIGSLKASLAKNPADPAIQYAMATKYANRFDMKSAAEHFQRLLELDSANTLGHNEEAEYTIANNALRMEKSGARMEAFVAKYPHSPMMRSALATLVTGALRGKDAEAAKRYFTQYSSAFPDDAVMMNNYAWGCAGAKMNLEQAAEVSKKAVALAKNDNERAMYLDTQATVEFERGNTSEAIALEEKALGYLKGATPQERKEYEASLEKFKSGKK